MRYFQINRNFCKCKSTGIGVCKRHVCVPSGSADEFIKDRCVVLFHRLQIKNHMITCNL